MKKGDKESRKRSRDSLKKKDWKNNAFKRRLKNSTASNC